MLRPATYNTHGTGAAGRKLHGCEKLVKQYSRFFTDLVVSELLTRLGSYIPGMRSEELEVFLVMTPHHKQDEWYVVYLDWRLNEELFFHDNVFEDIFQQPADEFTLGPGYNWDQEYRFLREFAKLQVGGWMNDLSQHRFEHTGNMNDKFMEQYPKPTVHTGKFYREYLKQREIVGREKWRKMILDLL